MFYLFIHALIITKISVLVQGIMDTVDIHLNQLGRNWLIRDWGSYSGDIVYLVLFKEYIWCLIQLFDEQV